MRKEDCIFCQIYRDHSVSFPVCTRKTDDIAAAELAFKSCPCNCFITLDLLIDLQDCGDIYSDFSRILK